METDERTLHLTETPRIPRDGLLLGWGAMVPFALLAGAGWWDAGWTATAAAAARLWGAAILLFFSGVRRGLSFRTEGGPRPRQLVVFALLFCLGLGALLLPVLPALLLVAGAFAAMAAEDVEAARRGEVPLYFRRLRPPQMTFAVLSVLLCAGMAWGA
ncbi:DUF3429 family protein [Oceaniglobus roseus]|uniref:DUF3429 family protein n=1 Tax=Oceaniglobus roseus TaxID=1737570 RepID=UPI000C7F502F|nr:DUF3429 family protein [Kandeliimicrobium roseum]